MEPEKLLYTTAEAAEMTGRKPVTVRQLAATHGIGRRIGRDWVFDDNDILRLRNIPKPGRPIVSKPNHAG